MTDRDQQIEFAFSCELGVAPRAPSQVREAGDKLLAAVAPATNFYERRVLFYRAYDEVAKVSGGGVVDAALMSILRSDAPGAADIREIVIKDTKAAMDAPRGPPPKLRVIPGGAR